MYEKVHYKFYTVGLKKYSTVVGRRCSKAEKFQWISRQRFNHLFKTTHVVRLVANKIYPEWPLYYRNVFSKLATSDHFSQ